MMGRMLVSRRSDERGVAAIMVALTLASFVIVAAMVLDFGLARLDRQANKAAADSAVAAGMRGLDGGTGEVFSYRGVCDAIEYLKANRPELGSLGWSGCDGSNDSVVCVPGNPLTYARFEQTVTDGDNTYIVQIRLPYTEADLLEFDEETKTTLASDRGDPTQAGCDQIGVNITQNRDPGLGSLATAGDIGSKIRSVGRVVIGEEGQGAVALLLLEREDCQSINTDGTNAKVLVKGTPTMPGMIHTDSLGNGDGCNSGSKVYNGNHTDGIVAEASQDGLLPGLLTTRALSGVAGANPDNATDPIPEVYGGPYPPGTSPDGRQLITRRPVDNRYLEAVRLAQADGHAKSSWTPADAAAAGWTVSTDCNLTPLEMAATRLYVNCPGNPGFKKANVILPLATDVIFNGIVSADNLDLPMAERVYVRGDWGAGVPTGFQVTPSFRMHHFGAATCSETATGNSANRAVFFLGGGQFKSSNTNALLQMCNTTMIIGGGQVGSWLPGDAGEDPVDNSSTGRIQITGGSQDWTAPNSTSDAADQSLWDQLEDLALWTEAYGAHTIAGGGSMHLSGVFMLPEANPFNIKGGGLQDVDNSQYIARKLNVTGGGTLTMMPNPNDVVTIPILGGFQMVR